MDRVRGRDGAAGRSGEDPLDAAMTGASRRILLAGAGIAAMAAGLASRAVAQTAPAPGTAGPAILDYPGKDKALSVLGDRPLVAETPEALLDDETTPIAKFFIRNNGQMPEAPADSERWTLVVDGEVERTLELTLAELKRRFPPKTYRMVLECGGNGRSFFQPQARGNPWTNGGIGCAEWTGVALADVLKAAGVKPSGAFTAHHGADPHLTGDATKESLSRGMPIAKATEEHNLLAFAMNGEPLPLIHGGPLRLLVPGWPGSLSHKWVTKITVRDREHDGQGMTGTSYRVPRRPMVPGGKADEAGFPHPGINAGALDHHQPRQRRPGGGRQPRPCRFGARPGRATSRSPRSRCRSMPARAGSPASDVAAGRRIATTGSAGRPSVRLPSDGYYEIWTRATDSEGRMQPHVPTNWNPQGYGGNAMHRVAILVG